jgi:hypothetical protein
MQQAVRAGNARAAFNLGNIYEQRGDRDRAMSWWDTAIRRFGRPITQLAS